MNSPRFLCCFDYSSLAETTQFSPGPPKQTDAGKLLNVDLGPAKTFQGTSVAATILKIVIVMLLTLHYRDYCLITLTMEPKYG